MTPLADTIAIDSKTDARRPVRRRPAWLRAAAAIVGSIAVLAGAVIVYGFDPSRETFFPRCPLHSTIGLYCPGCGATRCLHHLSHGRVITAFRYNPLVPVVLGYLAALGTIRLLRRSGIAIPRRTKPLHPRWIWSMFACILLFAVLRNLPVPPFDLLAPPANPPARPAG
jgi:hypothetical protein